MKKVSTFQERLNELIRRKGKTAVEISDATGIPAPTISRYRAGTREPITDNIAALASYFNVHVGYMMGYDEDINEKQTPYFSNPETQKIAEKIHNDKNLRLLFDAAENADPEDLQLVHNMLKHLKEKELGHDVE